MTRRPTTALGSEPGLRIRKLRQNRRMTLQELSTVSDVSVGYISQVERGQATPSLGTLAQLAAALGVSVDYFVATPRQADSVTRQAERPRFSVGASPLTYEQIGAEFPGHELTSFIVNMPVGYTSEETRHEGEDLIYVLEGTIEQVVEGHAFRLGTGDSIHFLGHLPHSWSNVGETPARVLWSGKMQHGATPSALRPGATHTPVDAKTDIPG